MVLKKKSSFPLTLLGVVPTISYRDPSIDVFIWNFQVLGFIDRYEIEKLTLENLRVWMSENVFPWMFYVSARGAANCLFILFFR